MADERARDVVRYVKEIEETGGVRAVWMQSPREPFGWFACTVWTEAGQRARTLDLFDPIANAQAAMSWLRQRYGRAG